MSRITKEGEYLWFNGKKIKISSIVNLRVLYVKDKHINHYKHYELTIWYIGFLGIVKSIKLIGFSKSGIIDAMNYLLDELRNDNENKDKRRIPAL
jgi:hypothetical protein